MKKAEEWVKEQRCPEEWASAKEVKMIQSDARQELITAILEAEKRLEAANIQTANREEQITRLIDAAEHLAARLRLWNLPDGEMLCSEDAEALKAWEDALSNNAKDSHE